MPTLHANVCAQCGQSQVERDEQGNERVAPMVHLATKGIHSTPDDMASLHLTCLPKSIEDTLRDKYGSMIDAAKSGKRGDALRAVGPDHQDDEYDSTEEDDQ